MLRDILIQKGLSNRESDVAELVTKGMSNKEVANRLFVTEKTVKFHLTNIFKKMNVKSRAQLIVWCLPHINFMDQREPNAPGEIPQAPGVQQAPGIQQAPGMQSTQGMPQIVPTTIPAGSSPVGGYPTAGQTREEPNTTEPIANDPNNFHGLPIRK